MSAVHRVDDIHSVPAARFFAWAWRLPHYRGVTRDRVLVYLREHEDEPQQAAAAVPQERRAPARAAKRAEPVTKADLGDPVLGKIFSFS